jgi:hypothetical protein
MGWPPTDHKRRVQNKSHMGGQNSLAVGNFDDPDFWQCVYRGHAFRNYPDSPTLLHSRWGLQATSNHRHAPGVTSSAVVAAVGLLVWKYQ